MKKHWLVMMSAMVQFGCPGIFCVARGSRVRTPRGEVNVETLVVGDEVVVVDPKTLEQHVGRISAVRSAKREFGRLDGLKLTSSHPLYDPEKNEWAPAGDWLLGMRTVMQMADGPRSVVQAERFAGIDDVFDLTVDHPLHTFVADGVVVHNKTPPRPLFAECPDETGAIVKAGTSCDCMHPDDEGRWSCNSAEGPASCSWCTQAVELYSAWRTAEGTGDPALRDGTRWSLNRCGAPGDLEVVADATSPGASNVLRLRENGCGTLERPFGDLPREGSIWFRFSGSGTTVTPVLRVNDLVLLGLAPAEGGLKLSMGSGSSTALSSDTLQRNTWYQFSWRFVWREGGAMLTPFLQRAGAPTPPWQLETGAPPPVPFVSVDGTPLESWYAAGNGFTFGGGPGLVLKLGRDTPGNGPLVQVSEVLIGQREFQADP